MTQADKRIDARVARHYGALSAKLRDAADYVVSHPVEIATRSLRSVSAASDVSPATFSRLARALGYASYEELRDISRHAISAQVMSPSDKAQQLQQGDGGGLSILDQQAGACMANISTLVHTIDANALNAAADAMRTARRVVLFGAFGSKGIVEYLAYLANFFAPNWVLADRMGSALGADLRTLQPQDVFLVVTKTPYARRAVLAAEIAQEQGATTVILSDSHTSPALAFGDFSFVIPSDSPQFFSSYVATLVLLEALISTIIAGSDDATSQRIRDVEKRNHRLGEFWAD